MNGKIISGSEHSRKVTVKTASDIWGALANIHNG